MKLSPYGGVIVALVTPFDQSLGGLRCSYQPFQETGCRRCRGHTDFGDYRRVSSTLTISEKIRLVSEVRDALPESAMVWAGFCSYNTGDSVGFYQANGESRSQRDSCCDSVLQQA